MPNVIVWSRPGCHLCDLAEAELARLADAAPESRTFSVISRNVDDDADRRARFTDLVPVIQVGDEVIAELTAHPDALARALDQVGLGPEPRETATRRWWRR